jgi:hypothetical protein
MPSLAWSAEVVCHSPNTDALSAIGPAATEPAIKPLAAALIGDETIDLSQCLIQAGKFFVLNASFTAASASGDVNAVYNTDPFITFGATTTNLVPGATTFGFLFGTPIVPGFYSSASSTGGVTVTNGPTGVTTVDNGLLPVYITGLGTLGLAQTDLGVGLGTAPCVAGPGAVSNTCNQGTTANSFAPAFFDNLEAVLSYSQDNLASVASWSGRIDLNAAAVPEPTSLMLLGAGLLAGAGFLRRRK